MSRTAGSFGSTSGSTDSGLAGFVGGFTEKVASIHRPESIPCTEPGPILETPVIVRLRKRQRAPQLRRSQGAE